MLPKEAHQLRNVAGQLNWVSTQRTPDMAYAARIVSRPIKDARVKGLITANTFFKICKSTEVVLLFPKIEAIESSALIWFSDTSFGNLKCGGSQGGMIVFMEGSNGK